VSPSPVWFPFAVTVHPHLALPRQGEGNMVVISVPRPWWEGLGEGVYCYQRTNVDFILD